MHPIYRYTSIGRPLDPAWPTNRAVLVLLPVAALLGIVVALGGDAGLTAALRSGGVFALAAFGSWALGRELLPDDHAAPFVSMALSLLACAAFASPGLLLLFATLGLVRIVNRSTGLAARWPDSLAVAALAIWAVYATGNTWPAGVAALAFFLDGQLSRPLRRQWLLALVCLLSMVVYAVDHDAPLLRLGTPDTLLDWLTVLALLLFALSLVLQHKLHSKGDVGGERLELARVKGGMAVGILAAMQSLGQPEDGVLLVATIGGLCLGTAFRRAFRSPAKSLRGH